MARHLGVTQNYVAAIESGARDPGPRIRKPLADLFGVGFFELLDVLLIDVDGRELPLVPGRRLPVARRLPGVAGAADGVVEISTT